MGEDVCEGVGMGDWVWVEGVGGSSLRFAFVGAHLYSTCDHVAGSALPQSFLVLQSGGCE